MMAPQLLAKKYDKIAAWWHEQHVDSQYGVKAFERALRFCSTPGKALDVGCGAGGRFIRRLQDRGFAVTGIDISPAMIRLARAAHPEQAFFLHDICTWQTDQRYDFIIAWDSIFHLPLAMHEPVVAKLCNFLSPGGILLYTFGDAEGEHSDEWRGELFSYSSIGITGNLTVLAENGITCKHLELDQWPQNHVYVIGQKL